MPLIGLVASFVPNIEGKLSAVGEVADWTSITFVYHVCSFLPLIGLVTWFLPDIEGSLGGRVARAA